MRQTILVIGFMISSAAFPQVGEEVATKHTCSYFAESIPERVTTFASDAEAEAVIKRIVGAAGLAKNFEVKAAGVPNAAAVIQGTRRYILYNQYFMLQTRQATKSEWAPTSIMAHEVAHHLNGHTLDNLGSRPKLELEADCGPGSSSKGLVPA